MGVESQLIALPKDGLFEILGRLLAHWPSFKALAHTCRYMATLAHDPLLAHLLTTLFHPLDSVVGVKRAMDMIHFFHTTCDLSIPLLKRTQLLTLISWLKVNPFHRGMPTHLRRVVVEVMLGRHQTASRHEKRALVHFLNLYGLIPQWDLQGSSVSTSRAMTRPIVAFWDWMVSPIRYARILFGRWRTFRTVVQTLGYSVVGSVFTPWILLYTGYTMARGYWIQALVALSLGSVNLHIYYSNFIC